MKIKFYFRLLLITLFGLLFLLSLPMLSLVFANDLETQNLGYAYVLLFVLSFVMIYYQCKAVKR